MINKMAACVLTYISTITTINNDQIFLQVAKHFGIPFFEVSSKNNINVDDSFLKMVSMINEMESDNTIKKVI